MNNTLFYSLYKRTRSMFENSDLAASGLPSAAELKLLEPWRGRVPEAVFTTEYQPPQTDGSGRNRANLKQAQALLIAAGWRVKARSEEHTSELQSLLRTSYAVFCLNKTNTTH